MNKATMFMASTLVIAMLVGFGASAAAPAEPDGEREVEMRSAGGHPEHPLPGDGCTGCPWDTEYLVVGSKGGLYTCCGCCPGCVEPNTRY